MSKRKRYEKCDRNEQLLEQCSPESMLHDPQQLELCYDQLIMAIIPKRRRKISNKDDDHCADSLHETLEDKEVVTHPAPAKTCRRILQFVSEEESEEGQKTVATSTSSPAASILQLDLPAVSDCGGCDRSLRDPEGGIGYYQKLVHPISTISTISTRSPWELKSTQNTTMVDKETLKQWAMVMQELKRHCMRH